MIVVSSTSIIKIDFKQTVKISDHYKGTLDLKQGICIWKEFEANLKEIKSNIDVNLKLIWSKFEVYLTQFENQHGN